MTSMHVEKTVLHISLSLLGLPPNPPIILHCLHLPAPIWTSRTYISLTLLGLPIPTLLSILHCSHPPDTLKLLHTHISLILLRLLTYKARSTLHLLHLYSLSRSTPPTPTFPPTLYTACTYIFLSVLVLPITLTWPYRTVPRVSAPH